MENTENYSNKAYDKALNLIKIRPHTAFEIQRKLTLKGFNGNIAKEVTEKLVKLGLINDALFAQTFLDNLIRFKDFGFYMLKVKLMQRGMSSSDAEALLKEQLPIELETKIAVRVVEKNLNIDRLKLAQKLSRRGFRSGVISRVIKESSAQAF